MKRYFILLFIVFSAVNLFADAIHSHLPTKHDIDRTKEVGEIPYVSQVNDLGAMTVNVPIEIYPDPRGFAPELSFAYNSNSGAGFMGIGWGIGGLSAITPVNKSYYYDGKTEGITLTSGDEFVLDGMRLIRKSTSTSKITFQSEQGYIKAEAILSNGIVKYFTVSFPDGRTGTFGLTTNTIARTSYPLTKMVDLLGNIINYEYDYVNNHYRIKEITYGVEKKGKVSFSYSTKTKKTDIIISYIGGQEVKYNYLLSSINAYYRDGSIYRTYSLGYTTSWNAYLLNKIDCSSVGTSLNPLIFKYGKDKLTTVQTLKSTQSQMPKYFAYTDSKPLLVRKGKFEPGTDNDCVITTEQKKWKKYTGQEDIYVNINLNSSTSTSFTLKTGEDFVDIFCADIDNSGKEKIIKVNNRNMVNLMDRLCFSIYDVTSTGVVFKKELNFDPGFVIEKSKSYSVTPKQYFVGDFTGRGKSEILVVTGNKTLGVTHPTWIYLFDLEENKTIYKGTNFTFNMEPDGSYYDSDKLFIIDYDGDGKNDICLINDSGTHIYTYTGTTLKKVSSYTTLNNSTIFSGRRVIIPADFNCDGKTDFILSPDYNLPTDFTWRFYLSKGDGTFDNSNTVSLGQHKNWKQYVVQDMNADGMPDLVETFSNGSEPLTVYQLSNLQKLGDPYKTTVPGKSVTIPTDLNSKYYYNYVMNIGPDGKIRKIYLDNNEGKNRYMHAFISSTGVVQHIEYSRLNELNNRFTRGTDATFPYFNYHGTYTVVNRASKYLEDVETDLTVYYYKNAVLHKQGLGFCGFEQIKAENTINKKTVTRTYEPYNFSMIKQIDNNTTTIDYVNSVTVDGNKFRTSRITSKTEKNKPTNVSVTTSYTYDSYGNITREFIDYGVDIKRTINNTYKNNTGTPYVLGLLENQSITYFRRSETDIVKTTSIKYNEKYQPIAKTYTGTALAEEKYSYDENWNLSEHSFRNYDTNNWLTTTYYHDEYGRLRRIKDPYSINEAYTYNSKGDLSQTTLHISGKITHEYDAWRLIKSVHPDGRQKIYEYTWSDPSSRTLYFITQTSTGERKTKTYYDALGRVVRNAQKGIDGTYKVVDTYYDTYGRLSKISQPYTSSASLWNTYTYDSYDRLIQLKYASGKVDKYSYSDKNKSVTETKDDVWVTKYYDESGQINRFVDDAGTTFVTRRADDKVRVYVGPFGNHVILYDEAGEVKSDQKPGQSRTDYTYNKSANTRIETRNSEKITYYYDDLNRLIKRQESGSSDLTTTYSYDKNNRLQTVTTGINSVTTYGYDTYSRLSSENVSLYNGSTSLKKTYNYTDGRMTSIKYTGKSGDIVTVKYDYTNEILSSMTAGSTVIWKLNKENEFCLPTDVTTGNLTRTNKYDSYGFPTENKIERGSSLLFHETYVFTPSTGNLKERLNKKHNRAESFGYDNFNRLTHYATAAGTKPPTAVEIMTYDNYGNILSKNDVGSYEYASYNKFRLASYTTPSNATVPHQTIKYSAFLGDRPDEIVTGTTRTKFFYNDNGERIRAITNNTTNNIISTDKYYIGNEYEYDEKNNRQILYLGGDAYSAPVAYVKDSREGTNWTFRYICRDYLGNVVYTTNTDATYTESVSYDPWGRMRSTSTHGVYPVGNEMPMRLGRSFGSHEQLTVHGFIHMNARLYNPLLGRFHSPDPYIQNPYLNQNYNPYSYALNNPMKYNDPTGELWHIAIGAGIGGTLNVIHKMANGQIDGFGDFAMAFGIGACAGALAATVGGAALTGMVALGAGATVTAGVVAGSAYLTHTAIQSTGNASYFNDPYPTPQEVGLGFSIAVSGGMVMQKLAAINAQNKTTPSSQVKKPDPVPAKTVPPGKDVGRIEFESSNFLKAESSAMKSITLDKDILYHYTDKNAATNISKIGFDINYSADKLIYLTDNPGLTPFQAKLDLGLHYSKPLPNALLKVNVKGLEPIIVRRVSGNLPGFGVGGGTEYIFNKNIPANRITLFKVDF